MESNIEKIVADNLLELRKSRGLKQTELSLAIGYSDKTVSRWENGTSMPDLATLVKLAEFYNVEIQDLLKEDATKTKTEKEFMSSREALANEIAVLVMSFLTVWLIAVIAYIGVIIVDGIYLWQIFVWAVPVSTFAMLYKVKKSYSVKWLNFLLYSFVVCGLVTSVYVYLLPYNFWQLYLVVVPLEGIGVITSFFRKKPNGKKRQQEKTVE